jgi:diadenosine tetraphosphatase ApaH/serine/threonine PP2A family protein phosphatase
LTKAILSDIHANQEALLAVREELRRDGVPDADVLNLGDIIGYGPNPRECLRDCMGFGLNLLGNHEEAVLFYPEDLSPTARRAADWTRAELNAGRYARAETEALWDFIASLDPRTLQGETLYIHASPRHPTRDYVFPADAKNDEKRREIFAGVPKWGFNGHTHIPGVLTESGHWLKPEDLAGRFRLGWEKCLINVGSVGQPRDADSRASWVLVDGDEVRFRRTSYDVQRAMERIHKSGLPVKLAERLKLGR